MIEYLIKSTLCLSILLAAYHLFFEKEKMHQYNRFYLIFSIGFGLVIPLITLSLPENPLLITKLQKLPEALENTYTLPAGLGTGIKNAGTNPKQYYSMLAIALYGFITIVLLIRFIRNLVRIGSIVSQNDRVKLAQGTIVLIEDNVVPHSFLGYTFLSKKEYLSGQTKDDILIHELTHVSQYHSIDLLIVEFLKVVFWFNPIFSLYRTAIQLNHEFLADEM